MRRYRKNVPSSGTKSRPTGKPRGLKIYKGMLYNFTQTMFLIQVLGLAMILTAEVNAET